MKIAYLPVSSRHICTWAAHAHNWRVACWRQRARPCIRSCSYCLCWSSFEARVRWSQVDCRNTSSGEPCRLRHPESLNWLSMRSTASRCPRVLGDSSLVELSCLNSSDRSTSKFPNNEMNWIDSINYFTTITTITFGFLLIKSLTAWMFPWAASRTNWSMLSGDETFELSSKRSFSWFAIFTVEWNETIKKAKT